MSVIDCIKGNFTDATVVRCSERGCKLRLSGLGNHVVLKGERVCKGRRICDCIIFTRDSYVIIGIVELKSKTIHSGEVVEKLTNGSEIALAILKKCSNNTPLNHKFYHVVLAKRWRNSEYVIITKRGKISVAGQKLPILLKRCGVSFSMLISTLK